MGRDIKMPNYNFKKDLPIAEKTERQIGQALENVGWKVLEYNNDNRYDLKVKSPKGNIKTIEIKEDFTCEKTGNVGVEFECRGKPSGISTSQADWYIYKVHQPNKETKYYKITTPMLKWLIKERLYHRIVSGGDPGSNSMNYLFRLEEFKKHSVCLNK